jgi:hypothetical protein
VERAEVLTTYLGMRSHLHLCIEHAPPTYDGRETTTRGAPEDVRKLTLQRAFMTLYHSGTLPGIVSDPGHGNGQILVSLAVTGVHRRRASPTPNFIGRGLEGGPQRFRCLACRSRADQRAASMNEVFSMILRYWVVTSCWLRWLEVMATSSISRVALLASARAMCSS